LADKVRLIYDLYGARDRFALLETRGPHKDTPELRQGEFGWMERWLKGTTGAVKDPERPPLTPPQLKVFSRLPDDAINSTIQETFIKPVRPQLPESREVARQWWSGQRPEWLRILQDKVFCGWPRSPPELQPRLAAETKHEGLCLRAVDFTSENDVQLRLWLLKAEKVEKPSLVILTAMDEPDWQEWVHDLGPAFQGALETEHPSKVDESKFDQNRRVLSYHRWAFATVAPRGIGPTRWAKPGTATDIHVRRRFALLGQTLDGQRVWDVRRALAVLRTIPELKAAPVWLHGKGVMAGVALYAALFEPDVARLELWHPPATHREGPIFLNVARFLDMPQAVAMAGPRPVYIYVNGAVEAGQWDWTLRLQRALGQETTKIRQLSD
jgi:hypothetical protein